MVYKKYIKRNGKIFGPYYYESYRTKDGKVKTRFISGPKDKDKKINKKEERIFKKLFFIIIVIILILFLYFFIKKYF